MGKTGANRRHGGVSLSDNPQLEQKRIKQIKFVLKERMKPEFMKRLDIISGRQLKNVLETKKGALYMLPEVLAASGKNEVHNLN